MSLSDKVCEGNGEPCFIKEDFYLEKDVKQAIKELKEELKKENEFNPIINEIINKIFGDKLV